MVRTRLNIGCRYSTPVLERPLHPTRSQFKPQPSQTQAPVTPATEPERRAGGGLTTHVHGEHVVCAVSGAAHRASRSRITTLFLSPALSPTICDLNPAVW